MDWKQELLDRLPACVPCGYEAGWEPASEPTAWAGLALWAYGQTGAARNAAAWLADRQTADGSVGVSGSQSTPCWPTSLAMLLWQAVDADDPARPYAERIERATNWVLAERSHTQPRRPQMGHDTTLVAWSWVTHTHAWLEPTALFVMALKAVGQAQHPRTREAVRMLLDRQLPHGGCNYGNTTVLGQELLPHVQPTGLVLMALADEPHDKRIDASLDFMQGALSAETTTASLAYGLLGLAAFDRAPAERLDWLQEAYERSLQQGASPYKLALIALATANDYPFRNVTGFTQSRRDAKDFVAT
jgi:hypothetical protein